MNESTPGSGRFKRQVVFRIGPEEWPLLERAAAAHGSIQAAVVAGLEALRDRDEPALAEREPVRAEESAEEEPISSDVRRDGQSDPGEVLTAAEAARILGLKNSTVRGYIRRGRLAGHYDGEPGWRGWLTTRAEVENYRSS